LIYIGDQFAFWIFALIMIVFLSGAIIAARLLSTKKPNKTKLTTYECGQDPFKEAHDYKILGITRYFGYATLFFAIDAFAWVVLTAAFSIKLNMVAIATVSLYVIVVMVGVFYFLTEMRNLVI
jgi:NADH-quinone oxidoreductase subunit A